MPLVLSDFRIKRPAYTTEQARGLEWLARAHEQSEATLACLDRIERAEFGQRVRRLLQRVGCDPSRVARRDHALGEMAGAEPPLVWDLAHKPHGAPLAARMCVFDEVVGRYFEDEWGEEEIAPSDLVHVTCTGYAAPSAAQRLVARRAWPTRVTHAYHMGCYAALPALRVAAGCLALGGERVDVAHTELCTLHFDPSDHAPEQLVIQSLFADGFARYSVRSGGPGLRVVALGEHLIPETEPAMSWTLSDFGMRMTLARETPDRIAAVAREVVTELFDRARVDRDEIARARFAIHPGGPKIVDLIADRLELDAEQVRASREVLLEHGNMSSATLPHVWSRLAREDRWIVSMAFGPGLTVATALFRAEA